MGDLLLTAQKYGSNSNRESALLILEALLRVLGIRDILVKNIGIRDIWEKN